MNREEFEKCHNNMIYEGLEVNPLEIIVIKKYFDFAWQEATTRQQKKIDEGHRKIEAQYNMIKSLQAYVESQQKTIEKLKCKIDNWINVKPMKETK